MIRISPGKGFLPCFASYGHGNYSIFAVFLRACYKHNRKKNFKSVSEKSVDDVTLGNF